MFIYKGEFSGIILHGLVLVFVVSVVFSGGILYLQFKGLPEELAMEPKIVEKAVIPYPLEIDQNFITQVNECFIPTAAVYGYNLRITSGFRSLSEQDYLYDQGRTVDGNIVTWAIPGKSLHNYGFAVDVADIWHGYDIDWKRLGEIGKFCGLEQVDDPHFENRGGLTTDQFEAGEKPLRLELPCEIMGTRANQSRTLTIDDLKMCGMVIF